MTQRMRGTLWTDSTFVAGIWYDFFSSDNFFVTLTSSVFRFHGSGQPFPATMVGVRIQPLAQIVLYYQQAKMMKKIDTAKKEAELEALKAK